MNGTRSVATILIALTAMLMAGVACSRTGSGTTSTSSTPSASPAGSTGSTPATDSAAPKNIAGQYDVSGTNENGAGNYKGTLEVIERGDVYQFKWDTAGKKYDGVGVRTGNYAAVAFAEGENGRGCGVVLYKVGSDGSLDGKAGYWGENSSESENGTRTKGTGVDGEYAITGKTPAGKEYKGTLTIKPEATGYAFQWNTGGSALTGFGIKQGDMLSVGIGGTKCGFVGYEIASDGTLNGKWGGYGSTSVGSETAKKK